MMSSPGFLREWVSKQVRRIRREDSEVGRPDVFLKREGYVSRARWSLCYAMSSFLYTLCGLYMIFTCDVLNRKYPAASGFWFWEGAFLVLQGPISYWNDVHNFSLDRLASSVDRTTAMCCFLVQIGKVFALPMPLPELWTMCVAGACFLSANTHLADLLSAAGEAEVAARSPMNEDGDNEDNDVLSAKMLSSRTVSRSASDAASSTSARSKKRGMMKMNTNSKSPELEQRANEAVASRRSRSRTPAPPMRSLQGIRRVKLKAPSQTRQIPGNSDKNESSGVEGKAKENKEMARLRAEVEAKFAAYLLWHTLWHVALPVPAIMLMAWDRRKEDLALLPGGLGELDLRQLLDPGNYY